MHCLFAAWAACDNKPIEKKKKNKKTKKKLTDSNSTLLYSYCANVYEQSMHTLPTCPYSMPVLMTTKRVRALS
jgi:hypothetical protein